MPGRAGQGPAQVKALVYVVDGVVARIRAVDPAGRWTADPDRPGFFEIPVGPPLAHEQAARQVPGIPLALGDVRPHVRGRIREYLPVS